jgi:hypothetical protein
LFNSNNVLNKRAPIGKADLVVIIIIFIIIITILNVSLRNNPGNASLNSKTVHVNGFHPENGTFTKEIDIWQDYKHRDRGVATTLTHGTEVKLIRRDGDAVYIEAPDGRRGWVTYYFIRELK